MCCVKKLFINKNSFYKLRYFMNRFTKFDPNFHNITTRGATIVEVMVGKSLLVYNGKKWIRVRVNKYMVGFKFGEFT